MRELAFGGRQTGRTTTLVMTMIEEMEMHDDPVYLVCSTFQLGMMVRDTVRHLNGDPSRVKVVGLNSLYTLDGVNALDIYIEHTAYEHANSRQLQQLYVL